MKKNQLKLHAAIIHSSGIHAVFCRNSWGKEYGKQCKQMLSYSLIIITSKIEI